MLSKEALEFILEMTDFMHGHYEDPEWGRDFGRPVSQILVALGAHVFAEAINNKEARNQIQRVARQSIASFANQVISTPDSIPPIEREVFCAQMSQFFQVTQKDTQFQAAPFNQMLVQLNTYLAAGGIADKGIRDSIQSAIKKALPGLAERASSQDPVPPAPHVKPGASR